MLPYCFLFALHIHVLSALRQNIHLAVDNCTPAGFASDKTFALSRSWGVHVIQYLNFGKFKWKSAQCMYNFLVAFDSRHGKKDIGTEALLTACAGDAQCENVHTLSAESKATRQKKRCAFTWQSVREDASSDTPIFLAPLVFLRESFHTDLGEDQRAWRA